MQSLLGSITFAIFSAGVLAAFIFWIWMLVDCATKEPDNNERLVWVIIIVFTHIIGALIYFFVRRPLRWEMAHR